ncbi:MAG: hypothetical protein PCFJNLEI_01753 [Verrucomicrobiae bacterium]|nr:hypothetical protein [Verrucomicrobiae bacterium]
MKSHGHRSRPAGMWSTRDLRSIPLTQSIPEAGGRLHYLGGLALRSATINRDQHTTCDNLSTHESKCP